MSTTPASELTELFAAEHDSMLRMATLMVGSAAIAEEIVQDGFESVSERWDSLDRPGGYLRTTVVNGCAQALRRRATEERFRRLSAVETATHLPTRFVELRDALDRLGDRQRMVIVLRYFIDIGDDDIAELLGVRSSTVRSIARRAFSVLRKELE